MRSATWKPSAAAKVAVLPFRRISTPASTGRVSSVAAAKATWSIASAQIGWECAGRLACWIVGITGIEGPDAFDRGFVARTAQFANRLGAAVELEMDLVVRQPAHHIHSSLADGHRALFLDLRRSSR